MAQRVILLLCLALYLGSEVGVAMNHMPMRNMSMMGMGSDMPMRGMGMRSRRMMGKILREICPDYEDDCVETAQRCIPCTCSKRYTPERKKELCSFINVCLNSTETRVIYDSYISEVRNGSDKCSGKEEEAFIDLRMNKTRPRMFGMNRDGGSFNFSGDRGFFNRRRRIMFSQYLKDRDEMLFEKFQCCMSEREGKFYANGTANAESWSRFAAGISDDVARTAAERSIGTCQNAGTACNSLNVTICIIQGCYDELNRNQP